MSSPNTLAPAVRNNVREDVDQGHAPSIPWNDVARILQILAPAVLVAAALAGLSTLERPEALGFLGAAIFFYIAWICLVYSLVQLFGEYSAQTRAVSVVALGVLGIALVPTFTARIATGLQQRARETQAPVDDQAMRRRARSEVSNLHKTYAKLSKTWIGEEAGLRSRCAICASALVLSSKMIETDSSDLDTLPSLYRDTRGVTLGQWTASNAREANARFGFAAASLEANMRQSGFPDQVAFAQVLSNGGGGNATNAENLALLAIRVGLGMAK